MKHPILISIISAMCLASMPPAAHADKNKNVLDLKSEISDNNIIYPESFEADTQKMLEGWYMKNYMATDRRYADEKDIPTDDKTFRNRLAKLPTVIDMPYNQIVRSYIERYTTGGRAQVAALLGLSHYYMPIFEQALEENGLPLELKYLPVIESGLDPNAVSRHGATGLWQFMLATAKGLGLEVSSLVDERRDPYLSSQVAAAYLKDLYAAYNDWSLAIAAYNCGPGAVNKAIRRAGGDPSKHDFWSIYNYLSPETRGYVPSFIAANYVMTYYPEHNISPVIPTKPLVTDTLSISERIHFNQISNVLDIPVEELRILNPQFRADLIPGDADHAYTLVLPSQQVHAYLMSEDAIRNFEAEKYARRVSATPGDLPADAVAEAEAETEPENTYEEMAQAPASQKATEETAQNATPGRTVTHKVAPGETLASIADKYGVSPEDIKGWNSLRRNAVRTGQILRINGQPDLAANAPRQTWQQTPAKTAKAATPASKKRAETKPAKPVTHTIKSGENLTVVAKKYGVSVDEIKKANGMTNDNLRAGASLKIPTKAGAKTSTSKGKSKSKKKRRR